MNSRFTLALIGNPNSGKSTLFNELTGSRQKVGNWSGVTVERKTGRFKHGKTQFDVVDLPGTYSLSAANNNDSIDQRIAQDFILNEPLDLLINIIDASSLERGLYLTSQLLDAGIPIVVALNMVDVAHQQGVHIDPFVLTENLGVPVIPIVASQGEGVDSLIDVIVTRLNNLSQGELLNDQPACQLPHSPVTDVLTAVLALPEKLNRLEAASALIDATTLGERLSEPSRAQISELLTTFEQQVGNRASDSLIEARYHWIANVTEGAIHQDQERNKNLTDKLDTIFLNRFLAFPLFLGVMYLMFMFTINLGGAFIDVFDITAGALFVELPRQIMTFLHSPEWLTTIIADGAGGGMQLVASFIPVIGTLFLFQSFLEGSGYMARAAFIVDRLMRAVGLPGKSFVPLVVGFGCNVPAIMSARTLDSQSDRLLTTLMAPFMSCGARLTVYILFATVFFPTQAQNVVFGLYVLGMVLAVITGFIIKNRLLQKGITPFIMELPDYHIPTLKGIAFNTWHKLNGFVMRAGKAIVMVVIVLNFVNSLGTDGSFGNENTEKSVLSNIGMALTPVFEPIGVKEDNWPATVGIFSGIFAKEVVVGTLDSLYTSMAHEQSPVTAPEGIWATIQEGFATIPPNLAALKDTLTDPLGIGVGDLSDQASAAEAQAVDQTTFALMMTLFNGSLAAFSYILFVLLYMPCIATLGAIYKEAGGFWAFFSAAWNTLIAYGAAVLCYQLGNLSQQPATALGWLLAIFALWVAGYVILLNLARRQIQPNRNLIPAINIS